MSENVESRIEVVRNKIKQKLKADDSRTVVGQYAGTKHYAERKEGEIWTDSDGKEWTVQNGIIQSISKTQRARMPLWCPRCNLTMSNKADDKMWYIFGHCFLCQYKIEQKMRELGTWEVYEARTIRRNKISWLKERKGELQGYMDSLNDITMVYEQGFYETFKMDYKVVKDDLQRDIDTINRSLDVLEAEDAQDTVEIKIPTLEEV